MHGVQKFDVLVFQFLDSSGYSLMSSLLLAKGKQRTVNPDDRPGFLGRYRITKHPPSISWAAFAPRVLMIPDQFPFGDVRLNPLPELFVFNAISRHHRDKPAFFAVNVVHRFTAAQLAVGDVQKVGAA